MGVQNVIPNHDAALHRSFVSALLNDVRALEYMLDHDLIETEVRRIGAEQELFVVDEACRPTRKALEILDLLQDSHFTTELAQYNLEFNCDPLEFEGTCLSDLENQILTQLATVRKAARQCGAEVMLMGILPTLKRSDTSLEGMTPNPRYAALNEALRKMRGRTYELFLRGTDELYIKHDSVMLESCNTSFQVHFQVSPHDFAKVYNITQAVAAPVLAVAANSPLLFGKRLWHETRIAIFQHAVDTRQPFQLMRDSMPRVTFGNRWVQQSVLEIFQEDIARYRVLLGTEIQENSVGLLQRGLTPHLRALQFHNGTVYRWNRPCYGLTGGKPHLRIENRILPSGPTVVDEIANAAFWFGLVNGMASQYDDITQMLDFDDAKSNFVAASRRGLKTQFMWFDKQTLPAKTLILEQLLPLARESLQHCGIDANDVARYLGIIERRVSTEQTGSQWFLDSANAMRCQTGINGECLGLLTAVALEYQQQNIPVHEWQIGPAERKGGRQHYYQRVEQYMTTDLMTVNENDTIELVLSMMKWRRIRHIPVEDRNSYLVGLVDYRSLIQAFQNGRDRDFAETPVSEIMQKKVATVTPNTNTLDAIMTMQKNGASCLPVVHRGRLIGIVTQNDFMRITAHLLEDGVTHPAVSPDS